MVPYKYKQLMEKDELYPSGWTHRKFFGPRKSKENPAKHARMENQIVTDVLNEKERNQKEENKLAEEGRLREEAAKLDQEMEEERIREEERIAAVQLEMELQEIATQSETGQHGSDSQAC